MPPLEDLGRLLLIVGAALLLIGLALLAASRLGLGRLPGDLVFRTDGVTCFVPLVTMLLLSLLLTILVNVVLALLRR